MHTDDRQAGHLPAAQCPTSGSRGKRVSDLTLEHLLTDEYRPQVGSSAWFFCADHDCPVVYFDASGATLGTAALNVRIGSKENEAPRPICYCFDHTIEEIEEEVSRTGTSLIPDSIAENCRLGLHQCEEKNPKGSCCLGDVRAAVKDAKLGVAEGETNPAAGEDCCAVEPPGPDRPGSSPGRVAALGALTSAVLSSACCWLPLLLLAFGVSSAGIGGIFERYRPWLLGVSAASLAAGFYLVYRRAPRCAPGDACSVAAGRSARMNKVFLWVASLFVAVFAFFPRYVGVFLGGESAGGPAAEGNLVVDLDFAIEGMTCEACAATLRERLARVPDVRSAWVDYDTGRAQLEFERDRPDPTRGEIEDAVRAEGYTAIFAPAGGSNSEG